MARGLSAAGLLPALGAPLIEPVPAVRGVHGRLTCRPRWRSVSGTSRTERIARQGGMTRVFCFDVHDLAHLKKAVNDMRRKTVDGL
jgi:hypothetical protein